MNTYRPNINDDDFTCRIIIEDFTFNGFPNAWAFTDCLSNMDYYFDRYRFSEEGRVQFARRKLVGLVRIYWDIIEGDCARRMVLIDTWDELKDKIKDTFLNHIGTAS